MADVPNLAGVATQDLVETIGGGNFKASYINWARTFNLLHEHAPGWCLEIMTTPDGGQVFRAPGNGGYLMLRFVHLDGTALPAVPQAIMDSRNGSIPFDKISARDVTDTHRRGGCLVAAMMFGLAHELWAKMPLESGYADHEGSLASSPVVGSQGAKQPTMQDFLEACLDKGLTTHAADALIELVAGNYAGGLKTLASKTPEWVAEQNQKAAPGPVEVEAKAAPKKNTKAKPEDY